MLTLNFNLQNHANAIAKLNEDLCRISNWTFRNQLLINPSKTVLIIFGSRAMVSKVEDFRLTLLGKEITPATVAKDLGVILDPSLTYNDHIASTVSGCMARLGQINRVKHAFDYDDVYKNLNHRLNKIKFELSWDVETNSGPVDGSKTIKAPYGQDNITLFGLNAGSQCVAMSLTALIYNHRNTIVSSK